MLCAVRVDDRPEPATAWRVRFPRNPNGQAAGCAGFCWKTEFWSVMSRGYGRPLSCAALYLVGRGASVPCLTRYSNNPQGALLGEEPRPARPALPATAFGVLGQIIPTVRNDARVAPALWTRRGELPSLSHAWPASVVPPLANPARYRARTILLAGSRGAAHPGRRSCRSARPWIV